MWRHLWRQQLHLLRQRYHPRIYGIRALVVEQDVGDGTRAASEWERVGNVYTCRKREREKPRERETRDRETEIKREDTQESCVCVHCACARTGRKSVCACICARVRAAERVISSLQRQSRLVFHAAQSLPS